MSKTIQGFYNTSGLLEQEEVVARSTIRAAHMRRMIRNANHHRSQAGRKWHQVPTSGDGVFGSAGSSSGDLGAILGAPDTVADVVVSGPPVELREQALEENGTSYVKHIWKSLDLAPGRKRLGLLFDLEEGSVRWRVREAPSGTWSAYTAHTATTRQTFSASVVLSDAGGEHQIEVDMKATDGDDPCRLFTVAIYEADMLVADL